MYIYALSNDNKVRDTTISLLQFEKWQNNFYPIAIFEDESKLTKKVLTKFSKVCKKQFSSLEDNQSQIINYFRQILFP